MDVHGVLQETDILLPTVNLCILNQPCNYGILSYAFVATLSLTQSMQVDVCRIEGHCAFDTWCFLFTANLCKDYAWWTLFYHFVRRYVVTKAHNLLLLDPQFKSWKVICDYVWTPITLCVLVWHKNVLAMSLHVQMHVGQFWNQASLAHQLWAIIKSQTETERIFNIAVQCSIIFIDPKSD